MAKFKTVKSLSVLHLGIIFRIMVSAKAGARLAGLARSKDSGSRLLVWLLGTGDLATVLVAARETWL